MTKPKPASPLPAPWSDPAGVAEHLRWLAWRTADPAYGRAARALLRDTGGRPAIDDTGDLDEAEALLATGKVTTRNAAYRLVARKYTGDQRRIRSIAERLRRKSIAESKISSTKQF